MRSQISTLLSHILAALLLALCASAQVINPPPLPLPAGPDTNAVPRVRIGTTTNVVTISGAIGGDFYNGAYTWNGTMYAKDPNTWIIRVEDHWEIQNCGTPEWGSHNFPFEWYPLTNPGYPAGEWGIGPVTNYDDTGNFYGNFVGTLNGQLPYVGIPGDMLASVWANGSADGNPNVVDNARYAGQSGSAGHASSADSTSYADSANYANNAGGWNGYGFPGGSGYLYFDGMGLSWGMPSSCGDMLASEWANGSADGNPNVVDHAAYAGSAGSTSYAGNSAQWNGYDMPGDPGFNSYVAFLAHNEYGQLTWVQADSWRGPQGEQGPPGEMSAYTWANGSSSGNPNVIDHASYADSAGNASYWNGMSAPSSDGLLFYSSTSGLSTVNDVVRQSGEQVVGADFVLQGSDQANVVVRGGYGGAHEQPGASITFGGSDAYNTPGQLTFDAGGITVSGQAGLDATRSWLGADGIINTVTITHGLITAWEQTPNP